MAILGQRKSLEGILVGGIGGGKAVRKIGARQPRARRARRRRLIRRQVVGAARRLRSRMRSVTSSTRG